MTDITNRIGRIDFAVEAIKALLEGGNEAKIFSGMFPTTIRKGDRLGIVEFIVHSPDFDEVSQGDEIPMYEMIIHEKNGKIDVETRKIGAQR